MFSPTHVVVTVRAGKNLLPKSKSGVNDAYATIEFNKEKYATASEKSNSPKWLTECTFALPTGGVFHNNVAVTVSVYNKKHGKLGLESDDLVGFANIPLSALNASDSRERCRWHKLVGKKKDSKKDRGEIEVAFKFVAKNLPIAADKKSPKVSRFLLTGGSSKEKGQRRRSEDEDSGVGMPITERKRKSFIGKSCENLTELFSSSRSNGSGGAAATTTDKPLFNGGKPPADLKTAHSARNSRRNLSVGGHFPEASRAISVEILHDSDAANKTATATDAASVRRSNSSGTKKSHLQGPTSAGKSLAEATNRNRSQSVIALNNIGQQSPVPQIKTPLNTTRNDNSSNSSPFKRDPPQISTVLSGASTVYKPRNSYRLDVKELMKVSTIPEDQKSSYELMSHEQLVALATHQHGVIKTKDETIRELEDYIDSLLLKVILVQPQILDKSCRVINR